MKETSYAKFWMSDGILIFIYKPIILLDYAIAKKVVEERLSYQQETSYPVLCNLRGILNSEKAARDYLANEGSCLLKAVAVVDERVITAVLLRYYLLKSKPLAPTQSFLNQEDALQFLKSFR